MSSNKSIAIVGVGAILPEAQDVQKFWENLLERRYSIKDVPADRWKAEYYYDPDPRATDKTYSKIGGWVEGYKFDPFKASIAIPPKVLSVMDEAQQWAIAACLQALQDYGYPSRPLNQERVAVILGNAMAGERHYRSSLRICAPEYLSALESLPEFQQLPESVRTALLNGMQSRVRNAIPDITEDTMPGELSNIIAGRVANVFNFTGPNFVTDAACASSLAAIETSIEGLMYNKFDAVLTGGVDRNMGPESFVKFSKIGALSGDGSRPYADGANGFVMGEGAVIFLLKRLEDAEAAGDKVYAVIRGVAGSSDGKGKGITAPNPLGQQRALERAWKDAGIDPRTVGLIEGHGTSTRVGDVTEVNSLNALLGNLGLKTGAVGLGSVKSNIGHLKSAAGAAGLLKVALGLYHKTLPPTANFDRPNPNINFNELPLRVITEATPWEVKAGEVRRAGVSSFGFGGTNFHLVVDEYLPGMLTAEKMNFPSAFPNTEKERNVTADVPVPQVGGAMPHVMQSDPVAEAEIRSFVLQTVSEKTGYPQEMLDLDLDLEADLGVDTVKQAELFAAIRTHYGIPRKEDLRLSDYNTLAKVVGFITDNMAGGTSVAPNTSEQKTGQAQVTELPNSIPASSPSSSSVSPTPYQGLLFQSANTRRELIEQIKNTLNAVKSGHVPPSVCPPQEAVSKQERIAVDYEDTAELEKRLEKAITALESNNPGMFSALQAQGIYYGSGTPGKIAFLFPGQGSQYVNMLKDFRESEPVVVETFAEADRVMTPILGKPLTSYIYVDGDEESITRAEKNLKDTTITQPAMLTANVALLRVMQKFGIQPDVVIGHSLGEYAALVASGVLSFAEALQVVSARGREMAKVSMADNGCMAAVSAPLAKVDEILKSVEGYVVIANINSPVQSVIGGATTAVDAAIAAFQAAGFQAVKIPVSHAFHTNIVAPASEPLMQVIDRMDVQPPQIPVIANVTGGEYPRTKPEIVSILGAQVASPVQFVKSMQKLVNMGTTVFVEVGPKRVLNSLANDNLKGVAGVTILATNHPRKGAKASFNEALCGLFAAGVCAGGASAAPESPSARFEAGNLPVISAPLTAEFSLTGSVVVTGAGLGLPGKNHPVFDDRNIQRIFSGEMMIEPLEEGVRNAMLEKRVTRLVKSEAGAEMQEITDLEQTLKLSGQRGEFDLEKDFGVPEERVESLDISTQLAIGAGIDALRDAGIPLVMNYRKTSKGTLLPDRLKLPESLQDETGVVFCAAFPGLNRVAEESDRFTRHQTWTRQLEEVNSIKQLILQMNPSGQTQLLNDLDRRIMILESQIAELNYHFDRRYVFRILSMGHSQFAEYIGARGPNTHVNAACATTTHGIAIAEDWIRTGRCRRVIVIAGDDVTNPDLVPWIGTSLFASGAATTEGNIRMAALPFDRRRNGMIMGMGAAALVIESEDAARERGVRGICEILSSQIANSAFHGTRLDIQHVSRVMNQLVEVAENRFHVNREKIAGRMVFVSHETYTPARGGSASAEIHALRDTFRNQADQVVIANTKGFTGHAMGVGIEDVVAVKSLEYETVPPIAHIQSDFEPDPELGNLNLSKGGKYPVEFALRLGAGFGSQIAMTLYRKIPGMGNRINVDIYQGWLDNVSGYNFTELEVVQRTLRVKNQGVPQHVPAQPQWQYGRLPQQWAVEAQQVAGTPERTVVKATSKPEPAPVVVYEAEVEQPIQIDVSDKDIQGYVLSVVSEKTGYPVEMLDLDLDLEADLGVDTVKQAELFATIRTNYGIPRKEDLRLADYNTLKKVIGFVVENRAGSQAADAPVPVADHPAEISRVRPAAPTWGMIADVAAIREHVLSVVSEKTGYPVEMLDLGLDLEADLGIDTVKQAELFAAIRTHYGIPRREDLRLSDYNTLQKVIEFVETGLRSQAAPTLAGKEETVPENVAETEDAAGTVQIFRREPLPVLRPRLDLCLPTGLKLDKETTVVVVSNPGKLADSLVKNLKKRGVDATICVPAGAEEFARSGKPVDGVYFLADQIPAEEQSVIAHSGWQTDLSDPLYHLLKAQPDLKFLIAATRMGGLFGLSGTCRNPLQGLVSGFVKAISRERASLLSKVVDLDETLPVKTLAERIIGETLFDPGVVEVGSEGQLRFGVAIRELKEAASQSPLKNDGVYLITGGTAGIIAPVVLELAKHHRGTYHLLGRTRLLDTTDPKLVLLRESPDELRRQISAEIQEDGKKPTPVLVEQEISSLEKSRGLHDLMQKTKALGSTISYHTCDVTSAEEMQSVLDEISARHKHIDLLIHAAGVEKSRKLESKPREEFSRVIQTKVDSYLLLMKLLAARNLLPERVVSFSSVAARFGNSGQTDYAAANDALNKLSTALKAEFPAMQVLSVDWGAWADVGMASRGNTPRLMEMAGIEMMPPHQAAAFLRQELAAGTNGEVMISASLGSLEQSTGPDAGIDIARADAALREGTPIHSMLSHLTAYNPDGTVSLEVDVDPKDYPMLMDHAINGIPVLPGVAGIEGFSIAARHIASVLAVARGEFNVTSLEDIHFHAPFKFYRNQPRHIQWKAYGVREQVGLVVYVNLESTLDLKSKVPEKMVHFTGKVLLAEAVMEQKMAVTPPAWQEKDSICSDDIYKLYFHGPSFQVLECAQRSGDIVLGKLNAGLIKDQGQKKATVSIPILVELCFQTAGLWEAGVTGVLSLPQSIERLVMFRPESENGEIFAEVKPVSRGDKVHFDARVVDSEGNVYLELENYQTVPLPYAAEKKLVEPLQVLLN